MTRLGLIAAMTGGAIAFLGALLASVPGASRAWMKDFPRSRSWGWALALLALLWAGWLLYETPLGAFEKYKPLVFVLTPVAYVLVILFVDELLAPRALGGLLLLVPAPMLDAARWHGSAYRYVILVLAYLFAVKGMALVLSPYLFRKTEERLLGSDTACRLWGGLGLGFGLFVVLLGFTAYR